MTPSVDIHSASLQVIYESLTKLKGFQVGSFQCLISTTKNPFSSFLRFEISKFQHGHIREYILYIASTAQITLQWKFLSCDETKKVN